MKNKKVYFKNQVEESIQSAVNIIYESVSSTLGPAGRNVIIEDEFGRQIITKDGVTVAKSLKVANPVENAVIQILKKAAIDTNIIAGDGTTTSTILATAILKQGMKMQKNGIPAIEVKNGIDKAVRYVINELHKMKREINGAEDIKYVASVSSNNDESISNMLAKVIEEIGNDGMINVESANRNEDYYEIINGLEMNSGYASSTFITNEHNYSAEFENPRILLFNDNLAEYKLILPLLQQSMEKSIPLVLIANNFSDNVMTVLIQNKYKMGAKVLAVKTPGVGDLKEDFITDLGILLNTKVYSNKISQDLAALPIAALGHCNKIVSTRNSTRLIGSHGNPELINDRVQRIFEEIENAENGRQKEKLAERIANLTGNVAIIKIGAETEIELNERKDRMDDAVHAAKAAVMDGILPGGGIALFNVKSLDYKKSSHYVSCTSHQQVGFEILIDCLDAPLRTLLINAGLVPEVVMDKIKKPGMGYNVRTGKFVNMFETGVIDPNLVVRTALEKAAGVAGLFLTTNCIITNDPDDKDVAMNDYM